MKRFSKSLLAVMLIVGLSGFVAEAKANTPLKIKVEQAYNSAYNYYYPKVIIISLVDSLVVTNVITNKGNCSPAFISETKATLKYGSRMEVRYKKCDVLLVEVLTDQGTWTVEY